MTYPIIQNKIKGFLLCGLLLPALAQAATWTSTDKWASWSNGGYKIENDVWGSNPGPQSLWANSYHNWGFWANHSGSGIKAYPNVDKSVGIRVESLKTCSSGFTASTASGSKYDLAYDIWCDNSTYEIMIWTNWSSTQPIAKSYNSQGVAVADFSNVSIGGHSYNVYSRWNGSKAVYSFLMTSHTNSTTVDIKSVLKWLDSKKWMSNPVLTKVQFGWEIITTPSGGANYSISNYYLNAN